MKPWKRPSLMFVLVAAMLVLLPLLAVLQYIWLGQVSKGDRESRQATLRTAATHFSLAFDRELTRAYTIFQMTFANVEGQSDGAQPYELWMSTAPHPKLIREIFLVRPESSGQLGLQHFDPAAKQFESSEWPPALSSLQQQLEHQQQLMNGDLAMSLRGMFEKLGRNAAIVGQGQVRSSVVVRSVQGQVIEDIPALLIPVVQPHSAAASSSQSDQRSPSSSESRRAKVGEVTRSSGTESRAFSISQAMAEHLPQSYLIVTLDLDYLQREFVPSLVKQTFANGDELNYNLAIVSRRKPPKILYQSGAPLPLEAWSSGDATTSLGSVRLDELRDLLLDSLAGRAGGQDRNALHADRFAISVLSNIPTTAQLPKRTSDDAKPWDLVIKHRAGSLDAAVESIRRRNLLISFGVLLLLGLSVGLLVISTRRAQRLAQRQMEFVSAVTHELRTPLAVIRSAGENLADGVIDGRGQVQRYGALIAGEGRRLTEMIEQVLEFAGAQSGRKTYELRPTEISEVIESMLAAYRPPIVEGGFHIELDLPPDLPPVKADAAALRHAMQNLLSNAMKYSGESRWLGLRAQSVMSGPGSELQIIVADHGLGIAPDDLPHIFEPFYRGKEVVAAQIHGNGLGLSLVKRIIEAHGGGVSVESAPGRGSAFILHLPIAAPTNEIAGAQAEEDVQAGNDQPSAIG